MKHVDIWDGWRGLAISFLLVGHFFETNWGFQLKEIIANLFFVRTYYPRNPHIWSVLAPIGHLWSQNVVEQSYIVMSAVTVVFLRNSFASIALVIMGFLSIGLGLSNYSDGITFNSDSLIRTEYAISFIFWSAGYNLLKKQFSIKPYAIVPVITFFASVFCYVELAPRWFSFSLATVLLAFTVNHLLDANKLIQIILKSKYLCLLGTWSFTIYIWQQPFYQYGHALIGGYATGLIMSIIVGAISFSIYERPIRTWINGRWTNTFTVPKNNGVVPQ